MNIISFLSAVSAPKDLWAKLIYWMQGSIGNFGWTLILVTLFVKVVTSPLDYISKLTSKKQTLVQQKLAPQLSKLQKKFGNDRQALQTQTQALYKHEGFNMGTGCIVMLINMIVSMVIFFTFYGTLRKVSAYEAIYQYEQIVDTYESAYCKSIMENDSTGTFVTEESVYNFDLNVEENKTFYDENISLFENATADASNAAVNYWDENRSSWFWIQNIWVADSTTSPFPSYQSLASLAKSGKYDGYIAENERFKEENYNKIATLINDNSRKNNGYFILAILAGLVTFASQYITKLNNGLKNKRAKKVAKSADATTNSTMKILQITLPVIMIIFVLTSTASFGLYILASNVASIVLGELVSLIVDVQTKNQRLAVEQELEKEANRLIKKGKLKE